MALAKNDVQQKPEHMANHMEAICKKLYNLTNKDTGERFQGKNLAQFAIDKGLATANIYAVVKGGRKQHKGWYLTEERLTKC